MNIGNIVYRVTGIMPKKEIVRRTSNIGHDILTHNKMKVSQVKILAISYQNTLGKTLKKYV